MFKFKRVQDDIFFVSMILAAALLMAWPLWSQSLLYAHDSITYFSKAVAVHQSWREGDFLARWSPHINNGYGYPSLNFYSPLFSYMAAFFMFFFPLALGFHVAIFFCLFLSGVAMYFFVREIWGKQGALLSSVAYLFAPYHILDIYVRGAVGEATAFIFFPLILLALYRLSGGIAVQHVLMGVAAVAGLILAHPLATLIFLPVALVYAVFLLFVQGRLDLRGLMAVAFVFAGAFLLSAYFLLPSFLEQKFVHVEKFLGYNYRDHFIYLDQIFYSKWGFGGSSGRTSGMSFMVGIVHLLLAAVLLVFWRRITLAMKGAGAQVLFFFILLVLSVFFTLHASTFFWQQVPALAYVQFPWRFLMLATLALSVLAGGAVCLFTGHARKIALFVACALIVGSNLIYCKVPRYIKIDQAWSTEAFVRQLKPHESGGFLPKWVRNEAILPYAEKLQVIQGVARVVDEGGRPLDRRFNVNASSLSVLCFYGYFFPGWEVFVNGKPVEIHPENPFGLIVFAVPPGDSSVRVRFGTTPVRQWGEGISLFALCIFVLLLVFRKRIDARFARGL